MPNERKEAIAKAMMTLLTECRVQKLTVKDIVDQCHITRQAFYYHFEGIPELIRWMLEGYFEQILQKTLAQESVEEGLRCFFVMAINAHPYFEQGMDSNYREEFEKILRQCFQRYFAQATQRQHFYENCTGSEIKILLRYHSQAFLGLLREWTEEDTRQLDQIVRTVYRLIMEGIPPQ